MSIVSIPVKPAPSAFSRITTQSILGSTNSAANFSNGFPFADTYKFPDLTTTGISAPSPVVVEPSSYSPFYVESDGQLKAIKAVPKFIVGPAPGTAYYNPDGVTVVPTYPTPQTSNTGFLSSGATEVFDQVPEMNPN
jgi:hypothetical protein